MGFTVATDSTAPATPPDINDTRGCTIFFL